MLDFSLWSRTTKLCHDDDYVWYSWFSISMFIYSFVVWITYSSPSYKLASAMGWFWAMYSIGIGVLGSYLPSFSIPIIGEMGTLWSSLIFILIGGLIAMFLVKDKKAKMSKHKA